MAFDFTTIYVVILLNSLLMAILWIIIYRAYERLPAAAIWSAACLLLVASGITLATASFMDDMVPVFLGNMLVTLAFSLFWAGLCCFDGRPVPWLAITALLVVTAAILVPLGFVDPDYSRRNIVYAVAQSVPLIGSILVLRPRHGRIGQRISAAAMGVALLSHAAQIIGNVLTLAGLIHRETYAAIEPGAILAVVFAGVVWNYGLVLAVLDRLYAALKHRALHDDLTGLANRRALVDRLAAEISAAEASRRPLSLLVVDLDGLKELNDRHGHQAGDAGIALVARTASARLRPGDMMARTGGDEFCVVLPDTAAEAAGAMAAALVGAVRSAPLVLDGRSLPLSLSVGAAEWQRGQNGDQLTASADAALYAAKAAGRDRHAVAGRSADADDAMFRPVAGRA